MIHGHDWLVGPAVIQLASMNKRVVFTMHSTETGRCGNVQYGGQSARIRGLAVLRERLPARSYTYIDNDIVYFNLAYIAIYTRDI